MATLPTTGVGNANATIANTWNSAPDNALTLVGDGAQDTNFGYVNTNTTNIYGQGWELNNMPADFLSMLTLSVQFRYGWSATPTNTTWDFVTFRVVDSLGATNLADETTMTEQGITTTTPTNSSVQSLTSPNTSATKSDWDGAVLIINLYRTRSKGGGTEQQRIYALSLTGTYTASVPEIIPNLVMARRGPS